MKDDERKELKKKFQKKVQNKKDHLTHKMI